MISVHHFRDNTKPLEVSTYTVNSKNGTTGNPDKILEGTRYQKHDSINSKLLAFQANKKVIENGYSSNSVHDVNSASSADEWVDLDDEDIEPENENRNGSSLTPSSIKSTLPPHGFNRMQNFIR